MSRLVHAASIAFLLAVTLAAAPFTQTAAGTAGGTRAFTNFRLLDGTDKPAVANAALVVRDGKVMSIGAASSVTIPAEAERIDLAGKTVLPGLVNAHGHVSNPDRDLRTYAAYGVTTVFSLGGENAATFAARDAQATPALDRSRVFAAGTVLAPTTVDQARQMVAANEAARADLVKIRVDDMLGTTEKMPPDVYRAVIDEAHKRNRRVAVHLFYLADAKGVLDAGADLIAHSVRDLAVDAAFIAALKSRNVCLVPTLMREVSTFVYESTPAFFSDPLFLAHADARQVATLKEPARQEAMRTSATAQRYKTALEVASKNLKTLSDAGVTIAMGTDTTGSNGRFQGYFEWMELEMMVKAGLTPRQALAAATRDAARCQRIDAQVGTLEPGKWADFLALSADPTADISNIRTLSDVFVAGNRVAR
ncbi:MAG TPA: amidohydrolase family protein [Vicinamibacterales bacterium]|nr:amidohydrolase family protein [Vicinamibacterales bacterium]